LNSVAIDVRCELSSNAGEEALKRFSNWDVRRVASSADARVAGDLDSVGEGGAKCWTWVPGTEPSVIDGVAAGGWSGAVRVVPEDWGGEIALAPWLIDDLAAVLGDLGRPLLVDAVSDTLPYNGVKRVASAFPTLTLILAGCGREPLRLAGALLRSCVNVCFVVGTMATDALSSEVAVLGTQRLVFGSSFPRHEDGYILNQVLDAELLSGKREEILRGRAERLLFGGMSSAEAER
jgi:hypothetical protein